MGQEIPVADSPWRRRGIHSKLVATMRLRGGASRRRPSLPRLSLARRRVSFCIPVLRLCCSCCRPDARVPPSAVGPRASSLAHPRGRGPRWLPGSLLAPPPVSRSRFGWVVASCCVRAAPLHPCGAGRRTQVVTDTSLPKFLGRSEGLSLAVPAAVPKCRPRRSAIHRWSPQALPATMNASEVHQIPGYVPACRASKPAGFTAQISPQPLARERSRSASCDGGHACRELCLPRRADRCPAAV